ncbi:thiol:disulfide interchange protein DsbA/DsbL [Neptunicella marina]|uniref:Thiol:disulfide interchange protein n=1 Tax=Neptunicella marina TaxID=2125989 RepID=A0A8J6IT65_9ALTE|nr:thiol:disulfide interchange protein DsbA/DsbL [Neptunicella marina]MBC3765874.1 thiol:disulfide interchange protein DsbA/DsbL [Neptunicella marina]
MIKRSLVLFATLLFSVFAFATDFTEGDYYQVLTGPATNNKEVREYFSFYCPHCYAKEPLMNALKQKLAADVTFTKNHVTGMPRRNIEIENLLTKAAITAEKLDMVDEVIPVIFNYIHRSHADFSEAKDIHNLLVLAGVDTDKFDKTFNSDAVEKQMQHLNDNTQILRKQGYSSVPTVVINGKYKVETKKVKSVGEYIELVNYLLNKPA